MTKKKREKKLIEVVDFEPMVSGNSCQEYTVDIAFQISGSRTYIFMKTMALPRFCNTLFHVAILILPSLQCLVILMFEYLTPLIAANLDKPVCHVQWELSCIRIHNEPQGAYLPVIQANLRYPNQMELFDAHINLCIDVLSIPSQWN